MKILFVTRSRSRNVGGVSTYSTELVTALRKYCSVTCIRPDARVRGRKLPSLYVLAALLARLIRSSFFDVIHLGDCALFPFSFIVEKRFPQSPIIVTAHGRDVTNQESQTLIGRFLRSYWSSCKRAPIATFIGNSPFTSECLRKYCYQPIVTIPLAGRPPCAPLQPPVSRDFVLFVGRIVPRKGVDWFIEQVLPRLPDVKLILVGQNYLPSEQFRRLISHSQVEYTPVEYGLVPAEIRDRAFACVVPNRESPIWDPEGFGIVAAEHAHTGRPTVATATQGLTAAVADGRTGFLLPPDADAWVKILTEIRNWETRQYEEFSKRCVAYAAEHFTWDRVARDTLRVYQRYVSVPAEINAIP